MKINNLKKYIGLCGLAVVSTSVQAQAIGFETQDYKALGVYDTWEQSPFRTGELQGNVAVVDNHLVTEDVNTSAKILGIQRSRFGSNTFGAKIDLNETFELTATVKYAHVMIHKPNQGRVMLIGLGKKANRAEQSNQVEQFWSYPVNDVKAGEWFDAVFPIKGNGGIDIYSLVLVPDCEAPHTLDADFVVYIDDIVINDDLRPRVGLGDYPVNFSSDAEWSRDDRKITGVNFNGGSDGNQTISISESELQGLMTKFETPFKAKAGDRITPSFGYTSGWMHGYVYLDKNKDGQFSAAVDGNDILDSSTDLVAYSLYRSGESGNGHNSAGNIVYESNNGFNVLNPPAFTIPSDLTPGIYRMRYKIDWNNIDPGGCINSSNHILNNGGGIVDVLLNIHADEVNVNQDNRNGEILVASTGETINNNRIPFGQDFKIKMNPSNGFEYNGIRVRHGYNLSGDSLVKSNPQYRDEYFYIDQFDTSDNTFTIPGRVIDGDVLIEGLFVEQGTGMHRTNVTYNITLNGKVISTQQHTVMSGNAYPEVTIATEASSDYYTITGIPEGAVPDEDTVIDLVLTQNLPFETSTAIDENTVWHNLYISASKNQLAHAPGVSYIDVTAGASGDNARWAFIGDIINGFKIVNRGTGEGYILSSSTNVTSSNDGQVFAIMTSEPVADTNNTYWIPTKSTSLSGEDGFFLHQLGYPTHRMNVRDNRLAYWVSGAGAGSTFTVSVFDESIPDIDYCTPSPVSGRAVSGGKTNRTDRYLSNVVLTDGVSSVTIAGGGTSSGRNVVVDRTSTIFVTEPGKTVTVNGTGLGFWVNTFLYVDFGLDGFTIEDLVFGNYQAGVSNKPTVEFTFTIPEGTPSGYYRARYFNDWNNTDPCYYGNAGDDNGELAMDFWIKVVNYGNVTFDVSGDGTIEGWSHLDSETGRPSANAVAVDHGASITTGTGSKVGFIFIPDADRMLTAVIISNGTDETFTLQDHSDHFIAIESVGAGDAYANAKSFLLSPVSGNVNVAATFDEDSGSIESIFGDEADGPIEYYNIQGMRIDAANLVPGVYIVRRGNKTAKIYIF